MQEVLKSFGIEGHILVWQVVNFSVLFLLLWKFLYKPIGKIMRAREEAVRESLERAERLEHDSKRKEQELRKQMADQRVGLESMYERARAEEKQLKMKMRAEAEEGAGKILEEARRAAEEERRRVLGSAEDDVRKIASFVAGKILEREVDGKMDRKLMEEAIRSIKK